MTYHSLMFLLSVFFTLFLFRVNGQSTCFTCTAIWCGGSDQKCVNSVSACSTSVYNSGCYTYGSFCDSSSTSSCGSSSTTISSSSAYYFYSMTISNIASSSIDAATVSGLVPSFQSVIKNAVNSISSNALSTTSYVYVSKVVSSSGSTLYGSRALEVTADDRQLQSSSYLTVTFSLYLSPSAATTLSGTLSSTISSKLGTYLLSESSITTSVKSALASASVYVSTLSYIWSDGLTYHYSNIYSSYSSVSGGSSTHYDHNLSNIDFLSRFKEKVKPFLRIQFSKNLQGNCKKS